MIKVQPEDFDVGAELAALRQGRTDVGAVASFIGVVRDVAGPGELSAMTLEHYPGMTERQLAGLEAQALARWPLDRVLIIHRFGRLLPGDQIVLCAATSSHREAAFEACAFLMDWLKTKAPFWKLEEVDGQASWVAAKQDDENAAARWQTPVSKAAKNKT
ncbi:MAG: molybdenum cofactor biosynthesis protein MoaE [Alphaproteobacteria bacterium]|nr:molybdenum cofactor biosynthesis protein MoaE [Alphaproteobacteria bacterium]